jgi:hypothetical protein
VAQCLRASKRLIVTRLRERSSRGRDQVVANSVPDTQEVEIRTGSPLPDDPERIARRNSSENLAVYAASRINQLRKSSSAASHLRTTWRSGRFATSRSLTTRLHVHGVQFLVLSRNGTKPAIFEGGYTVIVSPEEIVRLIMQFTV